MFRSPFSKTDFAELWKILKYSIACQFFFKLSLLMIWALKSSMLQQAYHGFSNNQTLKRPRSICFQLIGSISNVFTVVTELFLNMKQTQCLPKIHLYTRRLYSLILNHQSRLIPKGCSLWSMRLGLWQFSSSSNLRSCWKLSLIGTDLFEQFFS